MAKTLEEKIASLKGKLIVSCQALPDEPLHSSFIMGRMALAAQQGGASGIRANTKEDIAEIQQNVDLPIIGIVKRDYEDSVIYITPTMKEIDELMEVKPEIIRLMEYTRASLEAGVREAIAGNRIGDISHAVQSKAESGGYSVVRTLVGHGIGKHLHEGPEVPNFGRRGSGTRLERNLVICIEPMINMGTKNTRVQGDGWTVRTGDGKPSAHFEYAVAVRDGKPDLLSTFEYIEKVLTKR